MTCKWCGMDEDVRDDVECFRCNVMFSTLSLLERSTILKHLRRIVTFNRKRRKPAVDPRQMEIPES